MVDTKSNEWNSHVDLALWADLMVIAPITAKSMAMRLLVIVIIC